MSNILIGKIVKAQGLKGEVKIYPEADAQSICKVKHFFIGQKEYLVQTIRVYQNMLFVKFVDVNSREQAECLINKSVYLPKEEIALSQDEYLIDDLLNLKVLLDNGEDYGEIIEVNNFGASDILVIFGKYGKWQVPFIKDLVVKVDKDNNCIILSKSKFEDLKV